MRGDTKFRFEIEALLAIHERLRRLDVEPEDILVIVQGNNLGIGPRISGKDVPICFEIGPVWTGWRGDWSTAVAWWNDQRTSIGEKDALYQRVTMDDVKFLTVLAQHGISAKPPNPFTGKKPVGDA